MKTFYTQFVASLSLVFLISGCAALQSNNSTKPLVIEAAIDLVNIQEDKVQITIRPSSLAGDEIVFYIPQIVPGTYEYSNFGRFVEDLSFW